MRRVIPWLLLALALAALVYIFLTMQRLSDDVVRREQAAANEYRSALEVLAAEQPTPGMALALAIKISADNDFLPVVLTDSAGNIVTTRNLLSEAAQEASPTAAPDSASQRQGAEARRAQERRAFETMRQEGCDSLLVDLGAGERQTLYYGRSKLIGYLTALRWLQVLSVLLLIVAIYIGIRRSHERETMGIWRGLVLESAHQLGTPISSIGAWCELLEGGYDKPREAAAELSKDAQRLATVANRFEKLGRIPALQALPLEPDIEAALDYSRSRFARGIVLSFESQAGGRAVPHDPTLIQWAVENLCKNAADALSERRDGRIAVTLSLVGRYARIEVADNGCGMDKRTARHVFEAGYTTKKRGWGIGLALVRRICEEYHHGRASVPISRPGKGTVVRLEIQGIRV